MCTKLKCVVIDSTDKCTGRWRCGSAPKDELPDSRRSLANNIPYKKEQPNQEV